jgi:hypothetical protein
MKFFKIISLTATIALFGYIFVFANIGEQSVNRVEAVINTESIKQNSVLSMAVNENVEAKREDLSLSTTAGEYKTDDCFDIRHTDSTPVKVCVSDIGGAANGFYDPNKSLVVVESLDIATVVHELVHASTVHNSTQINDDIKRVTEPKFQERIAYDVEYMLKQLMERQR